MVNPASNDTNSPWEFSMSMPILEERAAHDAYSRDALVIAVVARGNVKTVIAACLPAAGTERTSISRVLAIRSESGVRAT